MKATISRQIDNYAVISSPGSATAPSLVQRDQNFPSGDLAIRSIMLRYNATISGTSTPTRVTNGHIFYLNALTVETDKHLKIVDAVDGLMLYNMLAFEYGTTPNATALTATPADSDTPACAWNIPFTLTKGIRPYDTNLDMLTARMRVSTQYGAVTNLWTQAGGSPLVVTNTQVIESKILPGPIVTDKMVKEAPSVYSEPETPIFVRSFEQLVFPITATATRYQMAIPFGDRIYRRIFIAQRNGSTRAEMTNVIAATAEVSLYVNTQPMIDRRLWANIQSENKLLYALETVPTGLAVLDFDADQQERIFDMLATITREAGNAYLYIDVTTQTNGQVWVGLDCLKQIPAAAVRG